MEPGHSARITDSIKAAMTICLNAGTADVRGLISVCLPCYCLSGAS